jgi:hypothetical protein
MATRLGKVVYIHPRHKYQEGQPMIKCVNPQWHAHGIMAICGLLAKTLATPNQMSSYLIETNNIPILGYGEFWGFFLVEQGHCHFVEHLACL